MLSVWNKGLHDAAAYDLDDRTRLTSSYACNLSFNIEKLQNQQHTITNTYIVSV